MNIDKLIKTNPTVLNPNDPAVIKVGEFYLPYSTGFEIECSMKKDVDATVFKNIPNIMHADINGSEQRFRIMPGIIGLQTLELISYNMRKYGLFNPLSGIHYHIDCTDVWEQFNNDNISINSEWMLNELDTWDYKGDYNARRIVFSGGHNWIRFNTDFKTAEIRIGEMTFDYGLLFKRITHGNHIIKVLKSRLDSSILSLYKDDYSDDIKNRIIKI